MKSLINRIMQGELFCDFTPEELHQLYTEVFPLAYIYDDIRYNASRWNFSYFYYDISNKIIVFEVETYYGEYSTDDWRIPVDILLSDNPVSEAKYKKAVKNLEFLHKRKNSAMQEVTDLSRKIFDQSKLISDLQLQRNTSD